MDRTAQLYWDDQDQRTAGWSLRFYDVHGDEHHVAIDGGKDATIEQLAAAVVEGLFGGAVDMMIQVYRRDEKRGWIRILDGVPTWRAMGPVI